jgi:putative flippase GtrA
MRIHYIEIGIVTEFHANNVFTFHPHVNMSQGNAVKCKTLLCAALRTASYQVLEADIVCS